MRIIRLMIACPDGLVIVAKVSHFLATSNDWI
ncbi:formyltetrahydrofolate deformylase, partial [Pseudomonas aeruginosa]